MPIYEYRCREGHTTDEYRSVDDRHLPVLCRECGATAEKIISKVGFAMPDIAGYQSMITGEWIGSRSKHRDHLRQHDCIEVGNEVPKTRPIARPPGLKEEIIRAVETTK